MGELLKRLGIEKEKVFNKDFDYFYDLYKQKALDIGRKGELRFIKERGKVVIYVVMDEFGNPDNDSNDGPIIID
jgi:hypothetical protein